MSSAYLQRVDRMSESLKQTIVKQGVDHPLRMHLVLASFPSNSNSVVEPLQLLLLDLQFTSAIASRFASALSNSLRSKAEREDGFYPWPANQHTFQMEPWQSMPPKLVSLLAAFLVLSLPWTVLLTIVCSYFLPPVAPDCEECESPQNNGGSVFGIGVCHRAGCGAALGRSDAMGSVPRYGRRVYWCCVDWTRCTYSLFGSQCLMYLWRRQSNHRHTLGCIQTATRDGPWSGGRASLQ